MKILKPTKAERRAAARPAAKPKSTINLNKPPKALNATEVRNGKAALQAAEDRRQRDLGHK